MSIRSKAPAPAAGFYPRVSSPSSRTSSLEHAFAALDLCRTFGDGRTAVKGDSRKVITHGHSVSSRSTAEHRQTCLGGRYSDLRAQESGSLCRATPAPPASLGFVDQAETSAVGIYRLGAAADRRPHVGHAA